ncbi:MAG: hypothetical protein HQK55_05440 [Deltaproteobacteria bacterium]|nr:hypothetical protein [Deltaproteobacteria bacterium]
MLIILICFGQSSAAVGVVGWGYNYSGQTTVPSGLTGVTAIAAGSYHSLALKSDGTVVAWGNNGFGQTSVPAGLSGVTAIAGGYGHSLALKSDGTVVAWGDNSLGQISVPAGLSGGTAVAAGSYHSLVLKSDGTVVAWGSNAFGQTSVPAGLSGVTAIAAGYQDSLALTSNGTVVAWGANGSGQTSVPVGLSGVTAIAAGGYHSLALTSDGTVVAWGSNAFGQTSVPAGLSGVTAIAAGYQDSLALTSNGTVVAWGANGSGQTSVPAGLSGVTAIAAGDSHSLALKSNGTVVAWGVNDFGQTSLPAGLSGVTAIAPGYHYSLALYSKTFTITASVTSTVGTGGTISPAGTTTVDSGADLTYTITPSTGYVITDVKVDGVSITVVTSYTFSSVTANHTIAATFTPQYTITASSGTHGTISPSGSAKVNYGGGLTYTITPATGYSIADVLVDGASAGAVGSYTFNAVTANHTISATFKINTYTITASAGAHGTISPSGSATVNYGGDQTFAITPATGYSIADVLVDGVSVGAVGSYTFSSVTAGHTISATFKINTYTITGSAGAHGTISPSGSATVDYGGDQTFAITPAMGYSIADVLVDGVSVGAVGSYTFSSVTAGHTISATFIVLPSDQNPITNTAGEESSGWGGCFISSIW